jgi:hypothetical protein
MDAFSISECELLWDTRKKMAKREKQALKKELKALSASIGKAIQFIKDAALEGSEPTVTWILGANLNYELYLFSTTCAESVRAGEEPLLEMALRDSQTGPQVTHIYSEKFRIALGALEEEDQFLLSDVIK